MKSEEGYQTTFYKRIRYLQTVTARLGVKNYLTLALYNKLPNDYTNAPAEFVAGASFTKLIAARKFINNHQYDWGEMTVNDNGKCYFYDEEEFVEALESLLGLSEDAL